MRRALSHVGGAVDVAATPGWEVEPLVAALSVSDDRDRVLRHVHGFHSYPARMHPDTAAGVIRALARAGQVVLDPFMGSGTVLVEARLAGHRAEGVDANPLAVELARLKAGGLDARSRHILGSAAQAVAEHAESRRLTRAGPTRRYGPRDRHLFDPHVLLELDGLASGIETLRPPDPVRRALRLVLSSILTKASRQLGDTSTETGPRRLASGFAVRLFYDRAALLVEQLAAFAAALPAPPPPFRVGVGDARDLSGIGDGTVGLVVTSPPYPGVYDYHAQHMTRLRWLGIDATSFEQCELGARRHYAALSPTAAIGAWEHELGACVHALGRVVARDGCAALLIADSAIDRTPLFADEVLARVASRCGLSLVLRASQRRPHFHGPSQDAFRRRPRREHLMVLARA
ncbi:MAG: hypothetical protein JW751_07410 [Polyangiaceae bacterium]|nr:hypothetical protein [Polyangiaceae bacterium]